MNDFKGPVVNFNDIDLEGLRAKFEELRTAAQEFAARHQTIQNITKYRAGKLTVDEEHEFLEGMVELAASGQLEALYEALNTMALENAFLRELIAKAKETEPHVTELERFIQHNAIAQRALVTIVETAIANPVPGSNAVQLTVTIRDPRLWTALKELSQSIKQTYAKERAPDLKQLRKERKEELRAKAVSPRQQHQARDEKERNKGAW